MNLGGQREAKQGGLFFHFMSWFHWNRSIVNRACENPFQLKQQGECLGILPPVLQRGITRFSSKWGISFKFIHQLLHNQLFLFNPFWPLDSPHPFKSLLGVKG